MQLTVHITDVRVIFSTVTFSLPIRGTVHKKNKIVDVTR